MKANSKEVNTANPAGYDAESDERKKQIEFAAPGNFVSPTDVPSGITTFHMRGIFWH